MDTIETHRLDGKILRIVRDRETFSRFRKRWDRALKDYAPASLYLSHQWLDAIWESYEDEIDGHVIMIDDAKGPCALAPLMHSPFRCGGLPISALVPMDHAQSARSDVPLIRDEAECIDILRAFTRKGGGRLWHLDRFPAQSTLIQWLGVDGDAARGIDFYATQALAVIDTAVSPHEFLHSKSQEFRNDCKILQDNLEGVEMTIHRQCGPEAAQLICAIRAAGSLDRRREAFLKRILSWASDRGALFAVTAARDGKPAGYAVGIAYRDTLYAIDLSCNRDNGAAPAGLGAMAELLWLAFDDPAIRRLDLDSLHPGQTWKRRWATALEDQICALALNGGIGSAALRAGRTIDGLKRAFVPARKLETGPMDEVA